MTLVSFQLKGFFFQLKGILSAIYLETLKSRFCQQSWRNVCRRILLYLCLLLSWWSHLKIEAAENDWMMLKLFSCNCRNPSCDCPFYIILLSPAALLPNTGDLESTVHRCCNILCCHFFLYSAGYFSSSANVNKHSCTSFACIAANKWPKTELY